MINKVFLVLKRIIMASLIIYTYDSLIFFSNHVIPINFINIIFVSLFDVIAMFYFILFSFM